MVFQVISLEETLKQQQVSSLDKVTTKTTLQVTTSQGTSLFILPKWNSFTSN